MNDNTKTLPDFVANDNSEIEELNELFAQIQNSNMPAELKEKTTVMVQRLHRVIKYGAFSKEYEPVAKYISWVSQFPWGKYTTDDLDVHNVKSQLDKTHYGLEVVKERLIEYIAMLNLRQRNQGFTQTVEAPEVISEEEFSNFGKSTDVKSPVQSPNNQTVDLSSQMSKLQGSSANAPIICFVGVQGIGKTSIAKSIASALGRKFVRIALGGLGGVTELRGRARGESDAEPGQIAKALIRSEVMNPLILMDEIDKISSQTGLRADVMAALLEILDPEQNSTFIDHYLDYPLDLSKVMFICTANNLGGISAALLDRLEVVRLTSYSDDEKMNIAKNYLLPKVLESSGILTSQVAFHDDVWPLVIRPLGFDAGIRQLERTLTTLVRKVAKKIVMGEADRFEITPTNFREFIPEEIGVYS
jgi:ATP-dependent Lon protease